MLLRAWHMSVKAVGACSLISGFWDQFASLNASSKWHPPVIHVSLMMSPSAEEKYQTPPPQWMTDNGVYIIHRILLHKEITPTNSISKRYPVKWRSIEPNARCGKLKLMRLLVRFVSPGSLNKGLTTHQSSNSSRSCELEPPLAFSLRTLLRNP